MTSEGNREMRETFTRNNPLSSTSTSASIGVAAPNAVQPILALSLPMTRSSFNPLLSNLESVRTTMSEEELLQRTHWATGEDAYLREDIRFRKTPWGRWMRSEDFLANDAIIYWLHAEGRSVISLEKAWERGDAVFNRRCVFCSADPRFVMHDEMLCLAAGELSRSSGEEFEPDDAEKYVTHLPLTTLRAAAASHPAGEWGRAAQEQTIDSLGWVRVTLPGKRLNNRMFVAEIQGHSMDDGKSGLVDGAMAVFELWPSGSKQNMIVLVRGAFHDPETGSYAVKKYVADERDADGLHHRVVLASLHPDKQRYPDIVLDPSHDHAITVVAKVVRALSLGEMERRSRPARQKGRRILDGQQGLELHGALLSKRIASFFGAAPISVNDEAAVEEGHGGWLARLVCFEAAAGGVFVEIGPLVGLPAFVKKVRLVGQGGWDSIILAGNARERVARVAPRPGSGPWRWEAVGFEEEQDLGLEKIALPAIESGTPTVFCVDAAGVGQLAYGRQLSLGRTYRILLGPEVARPTLGEEVCDGYRVWTIGPSALADPVVRDELETIGLAVGGAHPGLEWAISQPAAWRTNERGESYPVFEDGAEVFVRVRGVVLDVGESATMFLHGPGRTEGLPITEDGTVSLGKLAAGRFACALSHSHTTVPLATLVFEVAQQATQHVASKWAIDAPGGVPSLQVAAPPGWPVTFRWSVLHEDWLATLHADDNGSVDLERVVALAIDRGRREPVADLVVDLGELGSSKIACDGRLPLDGRRDRLAVLWSQHAALVTGRVGEWMTLIPFWFEPVTLLFGYRMEPFGAGVLDSLGANEVWRALGLAAWRLTVDERTWDGIVRSTSRVLVLTRDVETTLRSAREWMDRACTEGNVRDAVVTDGVYWTAVRRGVGLKRRIWNVQEVIEHGLLDKMLAELGEGL